MKKLLAILGATSLIASTGATVVACGPLSNATPPDFSKFNNSLPNMQGAASSWMKQLILSDQYGLSIPVMNNSLGKLDAQKIVKTNTGLDFDANDFGFGKDPNLNDLTDQYFGPGMKLDDISLIGEKIDLTGNKGENHDQLWKFLKDKFGVDLGDTADLITGIIGNILPSLNGGTLVDLIDQILPGLNGSLEGMLGLDKTLIELISMACKAIFTNEKLMTEVGTMVDSFDIGTIYSDLKVGDISSVSMISLSNAIGLFVSPDYEVSKIASEDVANSQKIAGYLKKSGENLGTSLATILFPEEGDTSSAKSNILDVDLFTNSLEKNIVRYTSAVANLFQFLELIQLQFSLFDFAKDFSPTDANCLFVEEEPTKETLKKVLGSGKTIREVTETPVGQNVQGSLNLKYLLSIFKNTFGDLGEDQNGYSLQKFLTILLIDFHDVDINNFKDSMVSPMASFLSETLLQIIGGFLKKEIGSAASVIPTLLRSPFRFLLTACFEVLLINPGQNLTDVLIIFLDKIQSLLNIASGFIPDPVIQDGLKALTTYWKKGLKPILVEILNKVPLLESHQTFQELYSGNPLNLEPLLDYLKDKELLAKIQNLYSNDKDKANDPLGKLLVYLGNALADLTPTLNNLLPGNLNLKNLLTTPLNQINNNSVIPPAFGGYYLSKSIVQIINDLCKKLNITGHEKLNDENVLIFNFQLSYLKEIFEMVVHYDHPGVPEEYRGQNLVSVLLENLDQLSTILGLKKDDDRKNMQDAYDIFYEGSLLDLIFRKILKVQEIKENEEQDIFKFFITLISSVFNNLNEPNMNNEEVFKNLFLDEEDFKFEYQPPIEDNYGTLLGQIIVVNYHNFENNSDWVYTLKYSREKVNNYFELNSLKKVAIKSK